jgi:V8-like Glu-specific endopeptidase
MIILSSLFSIEAIAIDQSNNFNEVNKVTEIEPNAGNVSTDPNINRKYNQFSDKEMEDIESRIEEDYSPRIIVGEDTRTQVFDISDHDYRTAARIVTTFPNGQTVACSSTLVSENMVLTNAHCVYDAQRGGLVTNVNVTPAQTSNNERPFGTVRSKRIFVPDNFVASGSYNYAVLEYDYALVELEQPIGNITGWKGIATDVTVDEITHNRYSMVGYPGDKPNGTLWLDHGDLWFATNDRKLIIHNLSTTPGSSGSGIYRKFSNKPSDLSYVIAVHAGSLHVDHTINNFAVNLTNTALNSKGDDIINWITEGKHNQKVRIQTALVDSYISWWENEGDMFLSNNSYTNQTFVLKYHPDKGAYQFWDVDETVILAWNITSYDGMQAFMHKNENKDEHYWVLEPVANNRYIISNYRDRNMVLDVAGANIFNGTRIQVHPKNRNTAQEFHLTESIWR